MRGRGYTVLQYFIRFFVKPKQQLAVLLNTIPNFDPKLISQALAFLAEKNINSFLSITINLENEKDENFFRLLG